MSIIDLLTILPYFVGLIFYVSQTNASRRFLWIIVVLRVLRLLRVFRILRVGRFLHSVQAVASAMVRCLRPFLILLLMLGAGMVFFSTLLYYAEQLQEDFDRKEQEWIYNEHSNNPGKLSPFQSIPHTLWWCIVTMTTVGYGDTYPITPTGKLVAAFTMLIGILILAFPVGVLSVKFGEELLNEVSVKEEHRFLRTRQDLVTAARLRTLSQLLEKFNAELESARASSQSIASSQAAMAKQLDQCKYYYASCSLSFLFPPSSSFCVTHSPRFQICTNLNKVELLEIKAPSFIGIYQRGEKGLEVKRKIDFQELVKE